MRPPPVATAAALRAYAGERALFLAQKCSIDYVRGKTGLSSYALFEEKRFLDALEVCRWESFATMLGDLLILIEGELRPHAPDGKKAALCDAVIGLYPAILASQPLPAHREQGWEDVIAESAARLRAASVAERQQALDVADHSARRLFDTLPIHLEMRKLDKEVVYGAVRFRMISLHQEMRRRLAAPELARQLLS